MYSEEGVTNTPLHCHNCDKNFVARIDYRIDGNHEIACPHCEHIHFRVITKGRVTDDRFSSDYRNQDTIKPLRLWKHDALPIETSSASHFIRDLWLGKMT